MRALSEFSGVTASSFAGPAGEEHFIVVEADPWLDFSEQLALLEFRYAEARRALDLAPETAVFRRIFLSDVLNQNDELKNSSLFRGPREGPVAVSIVQQPPLAGGKATLLAYHVDGAAPLMKRRLSAHHMLVERNGSRHLWSTGLCGGAMDSVGSAADQTRTVFEDLCGRLDGEGASLADNCVRTWIYVKGVDVFYKDMVRARSDLFEQAGLSADTHYIASTGIEGACGHQFDVVAMDAYSNLDLQPGQMTYLNDLERMCLTKDYKVTFERGTKIAWADRAHLHISGTASIDAAGQVVHPGDVAAQLDRALGNVEALLRNGGGDLEDLKYLIVYLRDSSDLPRVEARLRSSLGGLPTVFVYGPVCRPGWLVEIEGLAVTPERDPRRPSF
jgi:enamine deaminase RidA (YjgF/YER057c/UK114 family)